MIAKNIIDYIETFAPVETAEEWDNVGLQVGDINKEVKKILVSLDADENAVNEAIAQNVDMIITHHPLIFKPLSRITDKKIINLIKNDIVLYSAHTNLDKSEIGVNDSFADFLGLKNKIHNDFVTLGETKTVPFSQYIEFLKNKFNLPSVRACGDSDKSIKRVAVVGGSGGDFLFDLKNVDLFITGEASYHTAQFASENGICLVSLGHFESENHIVERLVKLLSEKFNVKVLASSEKNVYNIR